MLASRANEDVLGALNAPYTPGTQPGDYQPTPPTNFVIAAGWGALRTFGVRSSAQFRAPRPYSLQSLEYAMDVNEIAVLGKAGVSARTSDQTAIAFFWCENGSFAWNRIARKISGGLSLMQHARLYAALNAAISDAPAPWGCSRVAMSPDTSWRKRRSCMTTEADCARPPRWGSSPPGSETLEYVFHESSRNRNPPSRSLHASRRALSDN